MILHTLRVAGYTYQGPAFDFIHDAARYAPDYDEWCTRLANSRYYFTQDEVDNLHAYFFDDQSYIVDEDEDEDEDD